MSVVRWLITLFFLISLVFLYGFDHYKTCVGGRYLDTTFSTKCAERIWKKMGAEQRDCHRRITLYLDFPFLVSYGFVLIGLAYTSFSRRRFWFALPGIVAVLSDSVENILILSVFYSGRDLLRFILPFTIVKFTCLAVAILISLIAVSLRWKDRHQISRGNSRQERKWP